MDPLPNAEDRPRGRKGRIALGVLPWLAAGAMTAAWWFRRSKVQVQAAETPGLSKPMIAAPEHFETLEPGRGRLAHGPHRIPWQGWRDVLWRTYREMGKDKLPSVAGGVTFFTLLAVFPALGVFVSLYGLIADVGAVQTQLIQMATVFPAAALTILGDQMLRLASQPPAGLSVAFVISLLLSLWSANAGMKALFDGLNIAYDEDEKRHYLTRLALTYGFTLALVVFVVVAALVLVGGPILVEKLGIWSGWILPARWALLTLFAAIAFSLLYRYAPSRARPRWRWTVGGGAAAAVFWIGGSLAFSFYLNNIAHFDVTYGSLGAVIGFMMWIWFSVMAVLMGAELNAEIEHQTALDSTTGPPMPMGERGAAMADTVGLAFIGVRKGVGLLWGDARRQVGGLVGRARKRRTPP